MVELADDGNFLLDGRLDLRHQSWESRTRCRIDTGEQRLGGGDSSLQTLDNAGQGVADLRLLVQLGLEKVKDGRVEEGRV